MRFPRASSLLLAVLTLALCAQPWQRAHAVYVGTCIHRGGHIKEGGSLPAQVVSNNVKHFTDPAPIIPIDTAAHPPGFSVIGMTLERDSDNKIRFVATGNVYAENNWDAWYSAPLQMQYRAYDKDNKLIGAPMIIYFQLHGKGSNGLPPSFISYDHRPIDIPFDDVVSLRRMSMDFDAILNDNECHER
jgi:hypothetical protein